MVSEPQNIDVLEWQFDDENVEHLTLHRVFAFDILVAWQSLPLFFRNLPGRTATHVMVGPDSRGRVLQVAMLETEEPGRWRAITAWESRHARKIYEER